MGLVNVLVKLDNYNQPLYGMSDLRVLNAMWYTLLPILICSFESSVLFKKLLNEL